MEQQKSIEVFGTLIKTEKVFTIDQKVLSGSLVFEALEPFSGYYHETPFDTRPVYLYITLADNYPLEDIIRAGQYVEKELGATFDAGKGYLNIVNEKYNVLRVRHLNNYDLIARIETLFAECGIQFLVRSVKHQEAEGLVKIVKFLNLEEVDAGIWMDCKEQFHGYIELPRYHTWDEFKELTARVKYNWDGSKFDGAMGSFYYQGKVHEFARIYSHKISAEYLGELKKLYLNLMK